MHRAVDGVHLGLVGDGRRGDLRDERRDVCEDGRIDACPSSTTRTTYAASPAVAADVVTHPATMCSNRCRCRG